MVCKNLFIFLFCLKQITHQLFESYYFVFHACVYVYVDLHSSEQIIVDYMVFWADEWKYIDTEALCIRI